ncbi:hypothetical protein [Streptomyces sp. NPDC087787]|uniref:hypothetical protein n=1 Tax=Streptomyces sp. NPDC087787 TaxID=3365803 RepID=UPI00381562DE
MTGPPGPQGLFRVPRLRADDGELGTGPSRADGFGRMAPGVLCAGRMVSAATHASLWYRAGSHVPVVTPAEERLYPGSLVR